MTNLRVRVLEGALWTFASHGFGALVSLLGLLVMARALGPQTYGAFGAIWVVIGVAQIPVGGALSIGLVTRRDLDTGHLDATFWTVLAIAIGLAIGIVLFATPLAGAVRAEAAAPALAACAGTLPLMAIGNVPAALLSRQLRYRESALVASAATLAGNLAGIVAVFSGLGLWSLVVVAYMRVGVQSLASLAIVDWRPALRARRRHLADLGGINAKVLATYLIGYADDLLPRLLISTLMGSHALGYYNLAVRINAELVSIAAGPLAAIALPACAAVRDRADALRSLVTQLYRSASLLNYPALLGSAAVAPLLIPALFGAAWQPVVLLLQLFALAGLRGSINAFNLSLLQGVGRAGRPILLFAISLGMRCAVIGGLAGWGILAAGVAHLAAALATWPAAALMIAGATGVGLGAQLRPTLPALFASVAMAATVMLLLHLLAAWPPVAALSLAIGTAPLVYLAGLWLLSPTTVSTLWRIAVALARRDRDGVRAGVTGMG